MLRGPGQLQTENRNDAPRRGWVRIRASGWLVDQRGQMQDKLAATLATSFTERIRHSFAVPAVNGLVDWDTDEAMLRAKPADLTHGFPPGESGAARPPARR